MRRLLILAATIPLIFCQESKKSVSKSTTTLQLNNGASIMDAFEMLPKDCKKNGKVYKAGDDFSLGNLRYKCQKYGVYTIEGCLMKEDRPMKLGETVVVDNIKYQCLSVGSSVFYRETTCGTLGQPACDDISVPSKFEEAQKAHKNLTEEEKGKTSVGGVELPKGWRVVDGGTNKIPGTNASVMTQILMFNPVDHSTRIKRQSGHGIGRVVGVEEVKGEKGHPDMPMAMLMGGKSVKSVNQRSTSDQKVVGTQTVGTHLNTIKTGDKHDTGLVDLNERHEKAAGEDKVKMVDGTVRVSKSDTKWNGKTISVNGKTVGAGPGTFVFGNRPKDGGIFLKKED